MRLITLTVLLFCAPLLAQDAEKKLKVGDAPPEIQATYWLDTPPEMTTLAEMKGDVVFLMLWK